MVSRSSLVSLRVPIAIAMAAAALLTACADGGDAPMFDAARANGAGLSRIYRLGIGDKLKVSVYGEQDLSGTFEVNASGNVPMPLIGEIPAKGRPITEFREAVARKLSEGYLKAPKVSIEILNYRPIYVHGEVRNGGEFAFKTGLKLRDAVAAAGGYTYRAQQSWLLLIREGQSAPARVPLPSDLDVLPGDNIQVPERFF
jgi:protein involved in polysaccharide export with SLBB domain